jgi:hypothetical protein
MRACIGGFALYLFRKFFFDNRQEKLHVFFVSQGVGRLGRPTIGHVSDRLSIIMAHFQRIVYVGFKPLNSI